MPPTLIKILKCIGIIQLIQLWQNVFRTRFATDMYLAKLNVVTKTHTETFGEYKNKYNGQSIAIIATGPSLNKYKPIDGVINIGINKAVFYSKVKLDYFFTIDYTAIKECEEKILNYPDLKKFYGVLPETKFGSKWSIMKSCIIPESIVLKHKAKKYYIYSSKPVHPVPFNTDIDKTWVADGGSSTFSAMQFALFTNPRRIYLVGCDCSTGYFNGKGKNNAKPFIKVWKELKEFADIYYPETEIISVNPVGLKGLFKDLYQE